MSTTSAEFIPAAIYSLECQSAFVASYEQDNGQEKHQAIKDQWSLPISVPTGYACFPKEVSFTPKNWLSYRFKNVVSYSTFPVGGHFAAFEQPRLLAEDLRKFSRNVEEFYVKQNADEK